MLLIGYDGSYCKGFMTTEEFKKLCFDPSESKFKNTEALTETVNYCREKYALKGDVYVEPTVVTKDDLFQIRRAKKDNGFKKSDEDAPAGAFAYKLVIASSSWDGTDYEKPSVYEYSITSVPPMFFCFVAKDAGTAFRYYEDAAPKGTEFYTSGGIIYIKTGLDVNVNTVFFTAIEYCLRPVKYPQFCIAQEHGSFICIKA